MINPITYKSPAELMKSWSKDQLLECKEVYTYKKDNFGERTSKAGYLEYNRVINMLVIIDSELKKR